MSLLENAMEKFTVINKAIISDGLGGTTTTWTPGAEINGVMVFGSAAQAIMAQAAGTKSIYTFTVHKDVVLDFYTVVRKESDQKIFRLTSDSDDKKTPASAGLNMRQYTAEEWVLN